MAKKYKIYITIRKDINSKVKGWFIVDKKSPVDFKFDTKKHALEYVQKNYENVTVLVQNAQAKFQYTIELDDKKITSFVSKTKGKDADQTAKDVKDVFNYKEIITTTTTTVKKVPVKTSSTVDNSYLGFLGFIVFLLVLAIALAIAAIVIA
ncbi:MAG: hypothetical protein KAG91_02435, partial [Mycoplasmataceae bacterium]|nr:hypothetical protein [Mycoplasmataceae bacterium]